MKTGNYIRLGICIAVLLLTTCFSCHNASAASSVKQVLIINAFTPDYTANEQYVNGLKEALNTNIEYKFSYSYEYLDLARHPNREEYEEQTAQYMEKKYADLQPDFIVLQTEALSFWKNYLERIFPEVPAVITCDETLLPNVPNTSNCVVISQKVDPGKSLKLILQLKPETEKIYVVIGDSPQENIIMGRIQAQEKVYEGKIKICYMNQLTYEQMLDAVSNAGENSAVLYFRSPPDKEGETVLAAQVIKNITAGSRVPVFGTEGAYLGSGIVGGYIRDNTITGQAAAGAILELLDGKKSQDMPVIHVTPSQYAFDWRQLKLWNIDEGQLPLGSRVEFKEPGVWELYGNYILGTIALMILQALLILGLLVNQRRRRRAEKELVGANMALHEMTEKLIDLDRTKDEFLANTSHELQTPLNGIINISETLADGSFGNVNQKQKEELEVVLAITRRLSSLIRDIIDIEKIKRNELQLKCEPIDMKLAAATVADVFSHLIQIEKKEIIINIPEGLSPVLADENRLWQVLMNLIGNAVKFTERGTVTLSAGEDGQFVKIMIEDTGIGISKEQQKSIFNAFTQGGTEIARQYGGSGLGLYISRQLLERMNGNLVLEWSEPGKGTCFSLMLPKASGKPICTDSTAETGRETTYLLEKKSNQMLQGFKILAVDDEPTNLKVLKSLLEGEGYGVLTASNGLDALEMLKDQNDIDLVLMDVMMPGMSGYEACRRIRKDYSLYDLPLLLLTVRNAPEDIVAGFEAGANDFVVKPFVAKELRARVATLLLLKSSVQEALKNEMAFLQAQIKPHFLYNAMSTIMSFCYTDGERAGELLAALSEYLQKSFRIDNTVGTVSLGNELELTKAYTEIEKARFGDTLTVEYEVDERLLEQQVLPLTIQPLVENAIRHGLMTRESGGIVIIKVKKESDEIRISVEDNGIGIEEAEDPLKSKDSLKKQRGGVGLSNIRRRLMREYGTELSLYSGKNKGTKVAFTVPYQGGY